MSSVTIQLLIYYSARWFCAKYMSASFVDLDLEIDSEDRLITKSYIRKRDDFNFPIVNFPFMCSNIPDGVYISQLIRHSRACGSFHDFLDKGVQLTRKLLNKWFLRVKLKSSLQTFYGRRHDFC